MLVNIVNLKFWKKDDLALPELSSSSFGKNELGLGSTASSTGLDLSDHFQPAAGMPFQPGPATPSFSPTMTPAMPFSQSQGSFPPPPTGYAPVQEVEQHDKQAISKDLEVIAAKLDTIRAQLEMLNSRVANLERQNQGQQPQGRRPWY